MNSTWPYFGITVFKKNKKPQLLGTFGTTGGKPTFRLSNFPKTGSTTYFSFYASGQYVVSDANGSQSSPNPLTCTVHAPVKPKKDDSF